MTISKTVAEAINNSSWIRKMFDNGRHLIEQYGEENVFDFSIGNPIFEPPVEVITALIDLLKSDKKGLHRYASNQGIPLTRSFIAERLKKETGLDFSAKEIVVSAGAAGGLNVVIKTLCNPGDELLVFTPFFIEYRVYAQNHGVITKEVETTEQFQLDFEALEAAISEKTRIVVINSPNNPTGAVYSEKEIKQLAELLEKYSVKNGRPITLLSDEPYTRISYDDVVVPSIFNHYSESIVVTSHSKDLALPGQRIGYIAVSPETKDKERIIEGMVIAQRTLGFIHPSTLFQHLLPMCGEALIDTAVYKKNRDLLYNHLTDIGFSCVKPKGAFYLFPKCPGGDDLAFVNEAQKKKLLLVPGRGFGKPGYFRLAFCFETEKIERSLPIFTELQSLKV